MISSQAFVGGYTYLSEAEEVSVGINACVNRQKFNP
jgi:hypothetical protein